MFLALAQIPLKISELLPFLLPFLLVLAIVFGLLQLTPPKWPKAVDAVIAFVLAVLAATSPSVKGLLFANRALFVWIFVGIFFLVLAHEITKRLKESIGGRHELPLIGSLLVLILLATVFGSLYMEIPFLQGIVLTAGGLQNFLLIIGLGLLAIIFFFAWEIGKEEIPAARRAQIAEEEARKMEKERRKKEARG